MGFAEMLHNLYTLYLTSCFFQDASKKLEAIEKEKRVRDERRALESTEERETRMKGRRTEIALVYHVLNGIRSEFPITRY